jgi:hypothetical protein
MMDMMKSQSCWTNFEMTVESRNGWAYKLQQDCFEFLEKLLYKLNADIWKLTNKSVTYDSQKNKLTAFNLLFITGRPL